MPFGTKPGPDGQPIDFNRVYAEYIAPALEAAGLEPMRADQELRAGDIRLDMFQELLVADLVVADLTLDNPNVWYELGVRHALRARGVVLVSGGRVTTAFDLYTDRKLRYALRDGAPDPATLERDRSKLTEMVKATMESWHGRKLSPVYHLMPNLQEPEWKSLRIGDVREFWERHEAWENQLELARRGRRTGDLLVLAAEAPIAAFRAQAWFKAGEALSKAGRFRLALEHLERGLAIEPTNLLALRQQGICLERLALSGAPSHSLDRARQHYRRVLSTHPRDTETWALLGRVDKDAWTEAWRRPGSTRGEMRAAAADEDALLRAAIGTYSKGYRNNPGHYYAGINALTLMHLHRHLNEDPRYDRDMAIMSGAVRFAAANEADEQQLFWSRTTLADLGVLEDQEPKAIRSAYREAIALNEGNWFALHSSRAQLQLLLDLGFHEGAVEAGIDTFDRALERLEKPADRWEPRCVLLFSGHRIDAPGRSPARFPADKEPIAARKIAEVLEQLGAGDEDLAFSQAAAGGDLLFLEACQQRGVRCQVLLPFDEPQFVRRSVLPSDGGERWRERFYALRSKLQDPPRIMPEELGPVPKGVDPFERCNLWLLYSALACGQEKVRFVALWNGGGGDGPGGAAHLYNEMKDRTGRVTWLDTRQLW